MDGTTDGEGEENSKQVTTDVCHLRDVSESVHSGADNLFFEFSFSFFLANFALILFSIALSLSLIFSLPLIFSATLSLSLSSAT